MKKYKAEDYIKNNENIWLVKHLSFKEEIEHTHEFIEIEYIYSGEGHQIINGVTYHVKKGDLLFFNFGDKHSYVPENSIGIIDCLISPAFLGNELINSENALDILTLTSFKDFNGNLNNILSKISFEEKSILEIDAIFEIMLEEFSSKKKGYITLMKAYVDILLTKIFRVTKQQDNTSLYKDVKKIAPGILKYIEDNYNKKITLHDLAKASFYDPTYFSKIFKECYGKTLTQYISEKRLNTALELLLKTDYSIEEISIKVGYKDKKFFYKLFKDHICMTPNTYRELHKGNI